MSASSGRIPSPSSFFARTTALTYAVVAVVSFAAVFGTLAALGGFSGRASTTSHSVTVTFTETGLPSGTTFSVTFNGTNRTTVVSGTGVNQVQFAASPGLDEFLVGPVTGFTALPSSGEVRVNSTNLVLHISFTTSEVPIGAAFAAGDPVEGICQSGYAYSVNGCEAGDYVYSLTIESSSVDFGNVLCEVETSSGAVYSMPSLSGGFSIISPSVYVAAQATPITTGQGMVMNNTWSAYVTGTSASTQLTSLYTILIDMGTVDPTSLGLQFVVLGTGGYGGTTAPVALP